MRLSKCVRCLVLPLLAAPCPGEMRAQDSGRVPIEEWSLSGSRVDLRVPTQMERQYRVESSPDLVTWSTDLVSEPSDASVTTLGVDAPEGTARFFRVTVFDHEEFRGELAEAHQRWRDQRLATYSFEFRWQCHCPFSDWVRVSVEEEQVAGVTQAVDGQPLPADQWSTFVTVEGLFDWFEIQLGAHPVELRGVFDPVLGHPATGYVDISRGIADEERGFALRALTP